MNAARLSNGLNSGRWGPYGPQIYLQCCMKYWVWVWVWVWEILEMSLNLSLLMTARIIISPISGCSKFLCSFASRSKYASKEEETKNTTIQFHTQSVLVAASLHSEVQTWAPKHSFCQTSLPFLDLKALLAPPDVPSCRESDSFSSSVSSSYLFNGGWGGRGMVIIFSRWMHVKNCWGICTISRKNFQL